MFEAVEFPSEGATLRGRLYRPARAAPWPAVVMTHGTTATITMCLDRYAEVFCNAGLAVLLYDHRNFGLSGGEPRQLINPWLQARGYRDAMSYLLTRTDVRSDKIAAWGDSYSGMIALAVGYLAVEFIFDPANVIRGVGVQILVSLPLWIYFGWSEDYGARH